MPTKASRPDRSPVAYSYVRFSSPEQAQGDSLRRQTEAAAAWCKRYGCRLDTSTRLHDLGTSAFRGRHRADPEKNPLAAFLQLVRDGRVLSGSVLLIENMDRLSREKPVVGVNLLSGLLLAGVRVVQLSPDEIELTEDSDLFALLRGQMSQARGHDESKRKSEMVTAAWESRRRRTREAGEVYTRALPGWVECRDDKLRLVPGKAKTVRLIFRLAARGYGLARIVRKLTDDGVPCIYHRVPHWNRSYVSYILRDRRALGEFQPRSHGKPSGEPIPDYYPAVVTEEQWVAARAGAGRAGHLRGRTGAYVDIFRGLVKSARDGSAYYNDVAPGPDGPRRLLRNLSGVEGRGSIVSFPADTFEWAVLTLLRELRPGDVFPEEDAGDEVMAASGELASVNAELADAVADMEKNGFSPTIGRRVRQLEERQAAISQRLADAKQRNANPVGETLGEASALIDRLNNSDDPADTRLRLRAAVRRLVESIVLLVVPEKLTRVAAVQVWFHGGSHRDYLILHKHGRNGRQAYPPVRVAQSLTDAGLTGAAAAFDLRRPADAAALAKVLGEMDLAELAGESEKGKRGK
jgi:DNA invertase Pin-like site-specific DNA recombinase